MTTPRPDPADCPVYRSGAVARLTGIPVQTLRVWERRYRIVGPRQSAAGQRQYTPDDLGRLTVIKQLVDSGHAIGSIAKLDLNTLQSMLGKVARDPRPVPDLGPGAREGSMLPLRVVILGEALALRVAQFHLPELHIVATPSNVAGDLEDLRGLKADVLLVESPTLHGESAQSVRSWARQVGAPKILVEFSYAPQKITQELRALGFSLVRAPLQIEQLQSLCHPLRKSAQSPVASLLRTADLAAPRRFDRRMLAEISLASVVLSCECPHHLSDLLVQLGNFETYSAECESRSPADAALHLYLKEVAASARALLEEALVRVVEAEGISLPA